MVTGTHLFCFQRQKLSYINFGRSKESEISTNTRNILVEISLLIIVELVVFKRIIARSSKKLDSIIDILNTKHYLLVPGSISVVEGEFTRRLLEEDLVLGILVLGKMVSCFRKS